MSVFKAMHERIPLVVCFVVVVLTGSCGAVDRIVSADCVESDHPRVTVTSGTSPVFNWDPICRVRHLSVSGTEATSELWMIDGEISPPVTYGVVPRGAAETAVAAQLEKGKRYAVQIVYDGSGTGITTGAEFVP